MCNITLPFCGSLALSEKHYFFSEVQCCIEKMYVSFSMLQIVFLKLKTQYCTARVTTVPVNACIICLIYLQKNWIKIIWERALSKCILLDRSLVHWLFIWVLNAVEPRFYVSVIYVFPLFA
jgi:hypothetical protein